MTRKLSDINKDLNKLKQLLLKKDGFCATATSYIRIDPNDNARLKPNYIVTEEPEDTIDGLPIEMTTISKKTKPHVIIKNSPFVIDPAVNIQGVNRLEENNLLYLSVAPNYINSHLTENLIKHDSHIDDQAGKTNAKILITRLKKLHPNTRITLIVLGNQQEHENLSPYQEFLTQDPNFKVGSIEKYQVHTGVDKIPTDLYYLNAYDDILDVDTKGVDFLYKLYQETIGKKSPVLIHGKKGLDRTGKLAFAFELFRKYESIFKTVNVLDIGAHLFKAHEKLCRSRSIETLNKLSDFNQAVNLGMLFKTCGLIEECEKYLTDYALKLAEKKISKVSKLNELLTKMTNAESLQEQVDLLSESIADVELNHHRNLAFLPEFIQRMRPYTDSVVILKTLKSALEQRIALEKQLITLAPEDKNNEEEESTLAME